MSPNKLQKLADPKSSPETLALENINGKYFDDLAATMSVVMAHTSFGRTLKALPKDKGGIIEPLSQETFKIGEVVVGANLASINEAQLVLPGVPLQQTKITKLRNHFFKDPARLDGVVVGYIDDGVPLDGLGCWTCASPIELIHACWEAVAQDITANNKARVDQWAVMARATPVTFKKFQDADAFIYFNETMRWKTLTASVTIVHSPFQRTFVIYNFKRRAEASSKEPVTDVQVREMFKNVAFPDGSVMAEDKMSQHFVSQALLILLRWRLAPTTIILVGGLPQHLGICYMCMCYSGARGIQDVAGPSGTRVPAAWGS